MIGIVSPDGPWCKAAEDWADERWEQILRDPAAANHFRDMVDAFIAGATWLTSENLRQQQNHKPE